MPEIMPTFSPALRRGQFLIFKFFTFAMMYAEKYLNHFLFIVAGRARFATFARYVLNALRLPGPQALQDLADPFEAVLTKI